MNPTLSLPDLLSRIDALEERIWGGPPAEQVIDPERLLAILEQIGQDHLVRVRQEDADGPHRLELAEALQATLDRLDGGSENGPPLSLHQAALVQLGESLFRHLEYSADLDPLAFNALQHLQLGLLRALLMDPLALEPGRPGRVLCERLVQVAQGYDRQAGTRANELLDRFFDLVSGTLSPSDSPEAPFVAALQRLQQLLEQHNRETLPLVRDLVIREQGQARVSDARQLVSRAILQAVQGRRLPRVLVQFLQKVWGKYLYVTHLRQGMDSPEWRRGVQDIRILVHSFDIRDTDELLTFYTEHLSRALGRVRQHSASIHGDQALIERFFELMESVPVRIMGGDVPAEENILVTTPSDSFAAYDSGLEPRDSESLERLKLGRWFHLQEQELDIRCRLVERNESLRYCLFANLSGIKSARLTLREAARGLLSGRLRSVAWEKVMEEGLDFACRELTHQLPKLEAEAADAERERAVRAEQRRAQEAAQRLRRRHQEQVRAQELLLEERRRQEQERLRQRREEREQKERHAREQALQRAQDEVVRMQAGGTLEILDGQGRRSDCRLGLKIRASGKLIFVDRLGRKVLELLPEALAERMVAGSATITDYGVAFDDSLGILINEHSEKIHTDDDP